MKQNPADNHIDGERLRLILSTGRTGTTQFREFLKSARPHLHIAFEPEPSRILYLLANAEASGFLPEGAAARLALTARHKLLDHVSPARTIIEFDSYLSPLICRILPMFESSRIIHMVRHPYTWISSMANFKAASWRKHAVDFVPFTEIKHPAVMHRWRQLNKIEKLAWSWRYVNEQVLAQEDTASAYRLIRFEDFTSTDEDLRRQTINQMLSVIDPEYNDESLDYNVTDKLNKSDKKRIPEWKEWDEKTRLSVNETCDELMRVFAYPAETP